MIELKIQNIENIYHEIAIMLEPYKARKPLSVEFVVEGTKESPIVTIRYPGEKVVKRNFKQKRKNSILWGNLFDFKVIPYENGKEVKTNKFTFENMLKDFKENKINSERFWKQIEEVYYKNKFSGEPPKLPGINSKLYLLVLKWIWIQEDFNYKLSWKEVNSPTKYILLSRRGKRMSRGAGRAKFFAAMILLKHHFTFKDVKKIIPMYA